jgi:AraC-like DNA-binding protein
MALQAVKINPQDTYWFVQEKIVFVIVRKLDKARIHPLLEQCSVNLKNALPCQLTITSGEIIHNIQELKYGISSALGYAEYAHFLDNNLNIMDNIVKQKLLEGILAQFPFFELENYERTLISAIFQGDFMRAQVITNYYLVSHLIRDIETFSTTRTNIYQMLRLVLALAAKNPYQVHINDNRYNNIRQRILNCAKLKDMRAAISDFYILIDDFIKPMKDFNVHLRKIQTIVDYIKNNYSNPQICENQICEKFNISISHLSHAFKKCMGMNFTAYIQTLRINRAKHLINTTNDSMNTIAKNIGYSSGETMLKLFKRIEGISPSQYKRNYLKVTNDKSHLDP